MQRRPLLTAALALLPTVSLGEDEPAGDLDRLQGTRQTRVGPADDVIVTLSIDVNRFEQGVQTTPRPSFTTRGRLRIEGSVEPKRIEWVERTGPDGEPTPDVPAIHALDGDAPTVCSASPGGDRPDAFAAGRGRYPSLRTYRRVVETVEDDVAGELLAMQGDWSGEISPGGAMKASLSIRGRTTHFVIVGPDGQEVLDETGRVEVDETAERKAIDWNSEGDGSTTLKTIDEIDGPKLRVCLGLGRGPTPRPEAFSDDFRTFTLTKNREPAEGDEGPSVRP